MRSSSTLRHRNNLETKLYCRVQVAVVRNNTINKYINSRWGRVCRPTEDIPNLNIDWNLVVIEDATLNFKLVPREETPEEEELKNVVKKQREKAEERRNRYAYRWFEVNRS